VIRDPPPDACCAERVAAGLGCAGGSNVDVADEFTRLIQAQRGYLLNARVVQAWDDVQRMANELRSGS
jgi:flagellar basal body rod protein FlgG